MILSPPLFTQWSLSFYEDQFLFDADQFLCTRITFFLRGSISFYADHFIFTLITFFLRGSLSFYADQFLFTRINFFLRGSISFTRITFLFLYVDHLSFTQWSLSLYLRSSPCRVRWVHGGAAWARMRGWPGRARQRRWCRERWWRPSANGALPAARARTPPSQTSSCNTQTQEYIWSAGYPSRACTHATQSDQLLQYTIWSAGYP